MANCQFSSKQDVLRTPKEQGGRFYIRIYDVCSCGKKGKEKSKGMVPRNYRKEKDPEKGPAFASIDATQINLRMVLKNTTYLNQTLTDKFWHPNSQTELSPFDIYVIPTKTQDEDGQATLGLTAYFRCHWSTHYKEIT
jgi:hypothetical protein